MSDSPNSSTHPGERSFGSETPWKTSQANARRCITDEHQVRVRLSNGACLWTTYDADEPDVVCIEAGPPGRRDLICVEYDEFTIAGAALLEQRDAIIAQRDD